MVQGLKRRLTWIAILGAVLCGVGASSASATGVWVPERQLDQAGAGVSASYLVACVSDSLCVGASGSPGSLGGPVAYHLPPDGVPNSANAFGLTIPFGSGDNGVSLNALQCPGAGLCVGTAEYVTDEDDTADVVASATPAAGPSSWVPQHVEDPPTRLSCPTTSFCAGPGEDGAVVTSQDPTGGTSAWLATKLASTITDVACPSATFCLAVDTAGGVWTSADPSGGAAAWVHSSAVAPLIASGASQALDDDDGGDGEGTQMAEPLACSGPDLCVAAGSSGSVLVSTDPAGGAAWTAVPVSSAGVTAVDCLPGTALCLAGDADGNIATSDDGDGATWTSVATQDSAGIGDLSCAAGECMAAEAGFGGGVPLLATVPPSGGTFGWEPFRVVTHDALSSVSCPSAMACIGADQTRYYASADPTKGLSSWHAKVVAKVPDDSGVNTLDTACYSATGCLAVTDDSANGLADVAGGELDRFDPVGGAHDFHDTGLGKDATLFVACAQGTCVAGIPGDWRESSHPGLNRGWRRVVQPHFDVTCLTGNRSCVALADGPFPGTAGPDLLVAPRRSGPWTSQTIDPGGQITGLACPSARACVIVDAGGGMLVSTDPTGGRSTWSLTRTDLSGFNDVACETARSCVAVDDSGRVLVGRP